MLRERSIRNDNLDRIREYQEHDIPMLKENLAMLVNEREEMEQSLLKQTSEEFDRIKESLDEEVNSRLTINLDKSKGTRRRRDR